MKNVNVIKVYVIAVGLILLTPSAMRAQVPGIPQDPNKPHGGNDNGTGNNGINNSKNTNAPFDTGVGILIAAGAAIGAKKAYDKRKKAKSKKV